MNKLKTLAVILSLGLIATGCKKDQVDETKEAAVAEALEKKEVKTEKKEAPQAIELNIKPASFASKLVLSKMDETDFDINIDEAKNYSKIENGDFDVAVVPAYLAPYFYDKTSKGIELAAITSTGNIYMVSDTAIKSQMDYRGKTFLIPDPAGNLAKIVDSKIGALNRILRLKLEYFTNMDEIVGKMEAGEKYVAILSDPFYTRSLRGGTQYVSKVSDLLPLEEDDFLSEVIIVNKDYLKDNEEAFDKFLENYKKTIEEIDPETEIPEKLLKAYDLSKEEGKLALERMDLTYIDGDTMKGSYKVFMDRLGEIDESIFGEAKPGDDFYYLDK